MRGRGADREAAKGKGGNKREGKGGGCCSPEARGAEDKGVDGSYQRLSRCRARQMPAERHCPCPAGSLPLRVQCQPLSGRSLVSVSDPRRGERGAGRRREGGKSSNSSSQGPVGMGSIRDDGGGGVCEIWAGKELGSQPESVSSQVGSAPGQALSRTEPGQPQGTGSGQTTVPGTVCLLECRRLRTLAGG